MKDGTNATDSLHVIFSVTSFGCFLSLFFWIRWLSFGLAENRLSDVEVKAALGVFVGSLG